MNRTSLTTTAWSLIASMAALTTIGPSAARAAFTGGAPGGQRRWMLEFRVRLEQPGNQQPIEINLSGDWVSTICAVRPGEYDAALQLVDARLRGESSGSAQAKAAEAVQRRLTRPFWATYSEDGGLLAVHFYKDVDPGDRNLLQMIAAGIQFVRPNPAKDVWTVLERDGAWHRWRAKLEEDRVDALQPGGAFVDERLVQPDLGAGVADVRGWDP